jgi:hypothetical protein
MTKNELLEGAASQWYLQYPSFLIDGDGNAEMAAASGFLKAPLVLFTIATARWERRWFRCAMNPFRAPLTYSRISILFAT